MGLSTAGRGNNCSGFRGGGDVRPPPSEYSSTLYCDSSDTGAISAGRAVVRGTGDPKVVGSVQTQLCTGGREGGVRDGGFGAKEREGGRCWRSSCSGGGGGGGVAAEKESDKTEVGTYKDM